MQNYNELNPQITDSDIDDQRYKPSIMNSQNINLLGKNNTGYSISRQNSNNMNYSIPDNKLLTIKNEDIQNKKCLETENQNNILRNELCKMQEVIKAKDNSISEFVNLITTFKDKFIKFEEKNNELRKENDLLRQKLSNYENLIKNEQSKTQKTEAGLKNAKFFEIHIKEIQDEFADKELKLNQKFSEKENKLKNEFANEINKLNKKLDEIKVENEKLKYDISNQNLEIESLQTQLEDKDYEHSTNLNRKEKDNRRLQEKIDDFEKKIYYMENTRKDRIESLEQQIVELKEENANLLSEINTYKEKINEQQGDILNLNHNIEMLTSDSQQYKIGMNNKDILIEQLKTQIEQLSEELNQKDIDIQNYEQNKQNNFGEYSDQLTLLMKEKNELESQKAELTESLSIATDQLNKLKDLIEDKYYNIEANLFKETMKNENLEKKYKNILKQMKNKERSLFEENKSLKDIISEKELEKSQIELNYQNQLQNMSLLNNQGGGLNSSAFINNTMFNFPINNQNILNNSLMNNNISYNNIQMNNNLNATGNQNIINNTTTNIKVNNPNILCVEEQREENQKRTLEEFKKLLAKIDEKLDTPQHIA